MTDIESLLEEAEGLIHRDIEEELEALDNSIEPPVLNGEKYERARAMFEEVLSVDPENERAKYGQKACDDMLEFHVPVQYMAPPVVMETDVGPLGRPPAPMPGLHGEDTPVEKTEAQSIEKPVRYPWEVRRRMLDDLIARDRRGMAFTAKVFSEEGEKADKEVADIIEMALSEVKGGKDRSIVLEEATEELTRLQERLNRIWKGHGPPVREKGVEELKKQLDMG